MLLIFACDVKNIKSPTTAVSVSRSHSHYFHLDGVKMNIDIHVCKLSKFLDAHGDTHRSSPMWQNALTFMLPDGTEQLVNPRLIKGPKRANFRKGWRAVDELITEEYNGL